MSSTEYELQRCTRHCCVTGRELAEGEPFYSVLVGPGERLERRDYAAEAWSGPPEAAVGWWKAVMPTREQRRARMAPNDVLIEVFEEAGQRPDADDLRYVLALLLLRRRVLRIEERPGDPDPEVLVLSCARNEQTYEVRAAPPSAERIEQLQGELTRLLFAEGA